MVERRGLDPDVEQMRRLGHELVDWLVDHRGRELDEPVGAGEPVADSSARLAQPLPVDGLPLAASLQRLDELVLPHALRPSHPRFHGYIPTPGSWFGALGAFAAASLNPFLGSALGGGAHVAVELQVLDWIAELVGYPHVEGILTSGGSMANLGALAAARARVPQWRTDGLVLVSDQAHGSIAKAAGILGFHDEQVVRLRTDDDQRLVPADVAATIARARERGRRVVTLCANAGATNTGAVDPLDALADVAAAEDVWLHVDGAYGGFAAVTERGRGWLAGMGRADSLTLDPHKWMYAPIGCGCLLTRHADALAAAFGAEGDYLKHLDRTEVNFFDRGLELTRPARALPLWFLLRTAGADRLRAEVDADLDLAVEAEQRLGELASVEVVGRSLSIITFRLARRPGEDEAGRRAREDALVAQQARDGDALVSGTTVDGTPLLRLVVMNHRTTHAQLDRSIAALVAAIEGHAPVASEPSGPDA